MTVLQWCWIAVAICTIVFLVVSAVSILPKMNLRLTVTIVAIFLTASGITAFGTFNRAHHINLVSSGTSPGAVSSGPASSDNPVGFKAPPVLRNDGSAGRVIFTFDDGPDVYTPSIVTELSEMHIHAIFFVIGSKAIATPNIVRSEIASGDEVGDHTWTHESFTGKGSGSKPISLSEVRWELSKGAAAIKAAGAPAPTLYRPPYGGVSPADNKVAHSLGLQLVEDSSLNNTITESDDYTGLAPAKMAALIEAHMQNGEIFTFHDGIATAPNVLVALPMIVTWMNAHHFMATLRLPANTTGQWVPNLNKK